MTDLGHHLTHIRKLVLLQRDQIHFSRFAVDHNENGQEIKNCRKNCGDRDLSVGHTQRLSQNKCRSSHNRRHDLSPGRSDRFYRAGKLRAVTHFFHQRDRKRAGGHNITRRASRDHSHTSAGQTSCFSRTAAITAKSGN